MTLSLERDPWFRCGAWVGRHPQVVLAVVLLALIVGAAYTMSLYRQHLVDEEIIEFRGTIYSAPFFDSMPWHCRYHNCDTLGEAEI